MDKKPTSLQDVFSMPVRLVISICHPLLLVTYNDRMGVDYATTLTQALLQVLASYSMQRFFQLPRLNSHSHALNSHSHSHPTADFIPIPMGIPWDPWDPSLPHSHAHLYCEVCFVAPREEFALVPCGHARFCKSCANRVTVMDTCPVCRSNITMVMRIFM